MKETISDFKARLYKRQLWLERHPKIHKLIIYLLSTIVLVLVLLIRFIAGNDVTRNISLFLLITIFILLIIIDTYHVDMIKKNRFELQERKKLISELVNLKKNVYKVKYRRELFMIEPDGDAVYTRQMILEYDNADVAWAVMLFGTTNQFGKDFNRMILHAYTFSLPETKKEPLSRMQIETNQPPMIYAIVLKNKITDLHRSEGFQLEMKWSQAWKALMEIGTDDGILRIDFDTEECILELRLPQGYEFVDVQMPRTSIEPVYGPGRSSVTYQFRDLKMDDSYRYSVRVKKVKEN